MSYVEITDTLGNKHQAIGAKNLGWKHNVTSYTANADVFTSVLTPTPPSKIVIATIFTGTSPHMSIKRINNSVTVTHDVTLTSGAANETSIWSNPGDTFQIAFTVNGTINYLAVNETFGT